MSRPDLESQQMLDALREAVAETLERKRRLARYAVVWRDGKPEFVGEPPREPDTDEAKSLVRTQRNP